MPRTDLPNYAVPPFDGIGANEYVVEVTHDVPGPDGKPTPAVDFMSAVDTPYVWELNMWYHTLNAGFRTRASGETDFPCIYGERVGLGRAYVKMPTPQARLRPVGGRYGGGPQLRLRREEPPDRLPGRRREVGEAGSELRLASPGTVSAPRKVAALLDDAAAPGDSQPALLAAAYWDLERARIGDTREVPVELIVNGYPVARKNDRRRRRAAATWYSTRRSTAAVGWRCGFCRRHTPTPFLCWSVASPSGPAAGASTGA